MVPRTQPGSAERGELIRARRSELGLTIEQAASAARVGSESWRRYEQGAAMRQDKVRGVCRALRWPALPAMASGHDVDQTDDDSGGHAQKMWTLAAASDGYSPSLARDQGEACARVFALGYDFMTDRITDDLESLAGMPRGSHVGEIGHSWLASNLPSPWLTRYDYEFCWRLRGVVEDLRWRLKVPGDDGVLEVTRCPADDLALHLLFQLGAGVFDDVDDSPVGVGDVEAWELDLNGEDDEIISALFSDRFRPTVDDRWHFERWFDEYDSVGQYEGVDDHGEAIDGAASGPDQENEMLETTP